MKSPQMRQGWRIAVPVALAATLCVGVVPAGAATTDPDPSSRETAHAELSRTAATQGMVLLDNSGGALPIAGSGNVAVFDCSARRTATWSWCSTPAASWTRSSSRTSTPPRRTRQAERRSIRSS